MKKLRAYFKNGRLVDAIPVSTIITPAEKRDFDTEDFTFLTDEDIVTAKTNGKKYVIDPETKAVVDGDEFKADPRWALVDKIKSELIKNVEAL